MMASDNNVSASGRGWGRVGGTEGYVKPKKR